MVRIVVPERGGMSFGSGTLVHVDGRYGVVVTNWHVVRDAAGPVHVIFPDGFQSSGSVVKADRTWDLAAVAVWKPGAKPVELAKKPPRKGELLTIAGYGPVGTYRAAGGRCVGFVAPVGNYPQEMCEVSVQPRQGDSGGPIFNRRGELAGVLFGGSSGRTMGSHSDRVRWFLSNVIPAFDYREPERIASNQPPQRQKEKKQKRQAEKPALVKLDRLGPAKTDYRQNSNNKKPAIRPLPRDRVEPHVARVDLSPSPSVKGYPVEAQLKPGTSQITWQDIAGVTTGEQLKTILACIGVLAVLLHAIRLLAME